MIYGKLFRLIIALILLTIISYLLYYRSFQPSKISFKNGVSMYSNRTNTNPNVKIILEWTGILSGGVHTYWRSASLFCPELIPKCKFTDDKSFVDQADAVSFSIRQAGFSAANVPRRRYLDQRYVMYMGESAAHTYFDLKTVENLFNWTMTTRIDSDIWWPYGQFVPINQTSPEVQPNYGDPKTLVKNKTKLVAWYVSNCETHSKRETYVKELQKYIPVDIYSYGGCGPLKCNWTTENCYEKLAQNYYFYLAFENSVCNDYITEKMYFNIRHYVVPVVLRAKDYQKLDSDAYPVAPTNSFISVDNFSNPKELAKFLENLSKNEEKYLSYFDWHKEWKVNRYFSRNIGLCKLCRMLHQNLPSKIWGKELESWWLGTNNSSTCEADFAIKGKERW